MILVNNLILEVIFDIIDIKMVLTIFLLIKIVIKIRINDFI